MTKNDSDKAFTDANSEDKLPEKRTPRTIRFSDAEWARVEEAAANRDLLPATFARNAALAVAAGSTAMASGALTPGIVELIKRTYLSTYILSTLKRDKMLHEGHQEELDRTIQAAQDTQAFLLGDTSN